MDYDITFLIAILIALVIGFCVSQFFFVPHFANRVVSGMWLSERNWSEAIKTVDEHDPGGDWICINLKGMTYNEMLETIQHEIGHELFAQKCENNVSKCIQAMGA